MAIENTCPLGAGLLPSGGAVIAGRVGEDPQARHATMHPLEESVRRYSLRWLRPALSLALGITSVTDWAVAGLSRLGERGS